MRREPAVYLALLILSLVAFWPLRGNDFINYDDPDYVTKNPHVQSGITAASLRWAFTSTEYSNWHPLTWISHMLDCQLFGLNPLAQHVVNLGFHAANVLLLLLVFQQLTGALWRSAFVAALFALHPLHVESVAWIAERKDVLSGFFALLTVWAYIRYARRKKIQNYLLVLVLFAMGLMAKPMLVTLPVLLLLLDFWPLGRFASGTPQKSSKTPSATSSATQLLIEKLPLLALALGSSLITVWAQHHGGSTESLEVFPPGARVANALASYVSYLAKMFWPSHLAVFYPRHTIPTAEALGAGVLLAGICWIAITRRRSQPYLFFGWFWFLIALLPVIGLIQVGAQALADRYSYLPLIGPFVILAWGSAEIASRLKWPKAGIAFGASAVVLACAWCTRIQLPYWKDGATLFAHAIKVTSQNAVAENNLGGALFDNRNFAEAEPHFRAALAIRPNYPNAHFNLGLVLQFQGKIDEAESQFRAAIEALPVYARAHKSLGQLLLSMGNYADAENHLRTALGLKSGDIEAQRDLALALLMGGKKDEARSMLEGLVQRTPGDPALHQNLGNVYAMEDDPERAISEYSKALQLSPTNNLMREAFAAFLVKNNRSDEAIARLQEGLRIQPTVSLYTTLASIYTSRSNAVEAVRVYHDGLQFKPDAIAILNNLAWLLATSSDDRVRNGAEAVSLAEKACNLSQFKQPAFIGTLAAAYAEAGRFPDAVTTAQKACDAASAAGKPALLKKNQELLELYRGGHAYRESAP